jgi:methanogenic corrinoid protein MtbC1
VIRAWENRYGAVTPERSPGNHRLYSDEDIRRLLVLKRAVDTGHGIGRLASLETGEILELIAEDGVIPSDESNKNFGNGDEGEAQTYVEACLDAVKRLDSDGLWEVLYRSSIALGNLVVLEDVIGPLMQAIGDQWSEGSLRIIHEHTASAVIRTYLGDLLRSLKVSDPAPRAVAATLEGDTHEIGALISAVGAAMQGWKIHYLGPNLPWEEIARAVEIFDANLVMISVIMPSDDGYTENQLKKLRAFLTERVPIIIGGTPLSGEWNGLQIEGVIFIRDIRGLMAHLPNMHSE